MATIITSVITDANVWSDIVPTSLPPLTTFFEPPDGCSTQWIWYGAGSVSSGFSVPNMAAMGVQSDYYARCRPYDQVSARYSPGICTSGQTLAEMDELRFQSFVLWTGICCDSGMRYDTISEKCEKVFTPVMEVLTGISTTIPWLCEATNPTIYIVDLTTILCSSFESDGHTVHSTKQTILRQMPSRVSSGTAVAEPLVVYWQASDLNYFPVDYASSLASVMRVPFVATGLSSLTPSNTTTPVATPPPTDPNNKGHRLSPGAIAGIAIGIGALVISGIVILLYLWRRRKRRQRLQHPDVPEMEGSSRGLKRFMGGKWRAETDGTSEPVEAGSTSVRIIPGPPVELDGTQRERNQ